MLSDQMTPLPLSPRTLVRAAEALLDGGFSDVTGVIVEHAFNIAELPKAGRDVALTRLLAGHEAAGLDVGLMPKNARVFAESADAWIRDVVRIIESRGGLVAGTA